MCQFIQGTCFKAHLAKKDVGSNVGHSWILPWQGRLSSLYHHTGQESRGHKKGVLINLFETWSQLTGSIIWKSVFLTNGVAL